MPEICFVGIGANLGDPIAQAKSAIKSLKSIHLTECLSVSGLYCSKPLGPSDQPDYINAVAKLKTELQPLELLDELQAIEQSLGRKRKAERWGPRTIDLDILLFGNQTIHTDRLTIPHYHMGEREFVLYPLLEIAADLMLPEREALKDLVNRCPRNGLQRLEDIQSD